METKVTSNRQIPIDPSLFEWPSDKPSLIGSECGFCATVTFPVQDFCPRCGGTEVGDRALARHGVLWTWTTQEFPPKAPPYALDASGDSFRPYAVGYVELDGELRVETRLLAEDVDALHIGMPMRLHFEPLMTDENGCEVISFLFRPAIAA